MPVCTKTDEGHLARAIELADNGRGAVKPNPVVGAVVARDGAVLGEGWHERYGAAHAEVNAIEACGLEDLSGATLYVSLEPCCHEGKTPPCTEAILQSGIRRVVVASDDPTEKASGRGPGILRDEGIEYARRLMEAGVPTELHTVAGACHGFDIIVMNFANADMVGHSGKMEPTCELPSISVHSTRMPTTPRSMASSPSGRLVPTTAICVF